jgi:hypothetical protein
MDHDVRTVPQDVMPTQQGFTLKLVLSVVTKKFPEIGAIYGDQNLWQKVKSDEINKAVSKLKENMSLRGILQLLADDRANVAKNQNSKNWEFFGKPRDDALFTEMSDRYIPARCLCCLTFIYAGQNESKDFRITSVEKDGVIYKCYRSIGYIKSKDSKDIDIILTSSIFDDQGRGMWQHTDHNNINVILEHVSKLHGELLKPDYQLHQYMDFLARSAWWLFHATVYKRGSVSIVEWYIESINNYRQLHLGNLPWGLDLAAFSLAEEDYVRFFPHFFS